MFMSAYRLLAAMAACALGNGCVTAQTDSVSLQPKPKQEYVVRGGERLLASKQAHSVVVIRPVAAELVGETRPIFVVGIENPSRQPVDFRVANINVTVTAPQRQSLKVHTYDELVEEMHGRNSDEFFASLILADVSTQGANRAGAQLDTLGSYGMTDAAAKSSQIKSTVAAGNTVVLGGSILQGIDRLDELEKHVLKDGRVMPGQWHGGQLHIDRPPGDGRKAYTIAVMVGPDRHEFDIVQQTRSE
jgi:hypothetical protein